MKDLLFKFLFVVALLFFLLGLSPRASAQWIAPSCPNGGTADANGYCITAGVPQAPICDSNPCSLYLFNDQCYYNGVSVCGELQYPNPPKGCVKTGADCVKTLFPGAQCRNTSISHNPDGSTYLRGPGCYADYSQNSAPACGVLGWIGCPVGSPPNPNPAGSDAGYYGFQFYIPGGPTPTPTPTPTVTPTSCITYGTAGDLSYPNTCSGTNGFFTDKCSGNQTVTYSCNPSGACQSFTSACNTGETCVEEPANGLTHCVIVPTPAPYNLIF